MDINQEEFINKYKKKNIQARNLHSLIYIAICIIVPLSFFIYVLIDVKSTLNKSYGLEIYNSGLHYGIQISMIMFGVLLIIFGSVIYLIFRYHKRFLTVLNTLSEKDLDKLQRITVDLPLIEKYTPSFLLRNNSIVIINFLLVKEISFKEIISLDIKFISYRNRKYLVKIIYNG